MMLMNSNNNDDNHNSRSNSLQSECGGMDCEEFPVFHMGVLKGARQVLLSRSIQGMKDSTWNARWHCTSL